MARIALIPGDGIGIEVVSEAVRVLEVVRELGAPTLEWDEWELGAERYLHTGVTISEEEFQTLSDDYDAILLGALGDPRVPTNVHARDILLGLRFRLDLYVNYRPARLLTPALSPLRDGERGFDLRIFRENTEGVYTGLGGSFKVGTPDEVAIQEDLNSWKGVERIIRAAFEHARDHGRERVTLVDKANAMSHAGKLWRRAFREVGEEFPEFEQDTMYVDAMVMDMVRRPERYDVVVTNNLFGDILSDLAAVLAGGMGVAASANLHPGRHALFEPVHGSAPDIVGTGSANPMAAILCVSLMLGHFGESELAGEVEGAVADAVAEGVMTPDLGGEHTTTQVGEWIAARVESRLSTHP